MPIMKGHSHNVVSSNVREMIRSGHKPKQAIAAALSSARKYKKMSDGGQVVDDGGMGDIPQEEYFKGGKDASMAEMDRKGPEDYERSLGTIQVEGEYHPEEVSNPNEQMEDFNFAQALKKKKMSDSMSPENYAMGGLVQGEEDEPLGSKPSEDMRGVMAEDEQISRNVGKPEMKEPSGMGLSQEALRALKEKKMKRRFVA